MSEECPLGQRPASSAHRAMREPAGQEGGAQQPPPPLSAVGHDIGLRAAEAAAAAAAAAGPGGYVAGTRGPGRCGSAAHACGRHSGATACRDARLCAVRELAVRMLVGCDRHRLALELCGRLS